MAWPIQLSPDQSDALYAAVCQYRDFVREDKPQVYAMVAIVASMMERGLTLDIPEQKLVQGVLQEWLSMMDESEWNEHLEKAYFKLYGEWPVEPPWFVKKHNMKWPI